MKDQTDETNAPNDGSSSGRGDVSVQEGGNGVSVVVFGGRDGNRFDPALVQALTEALTRLIAAPDTRKIVVAARGADFCAGAWRDLPPPSPDAAAVPPVMASVSALCSVLEAAPQPVIAAVQGRVASAGLALALACDGIIADARAAFHFPEPGLARLPAGNGAVRLTWRMGPQAALSLLDRANPIDARTALAMGLIDRISDAGVVSEASDWAQRLDAKRHADTSGWIAQTAQAIGPALARLGPRVAPHRRAARALIESVEGAMLLPPDQALAFDQIRAEDAAVAPAARALAHLARATRRALDTPEARAQGAAPVLRRRLGIMMPPQDVAGRALPLLRAGVPLCILGRDAEQETASVTALGRAQEMLVRQGALSRDQAQQDLARISMGHTTGQTAGQAAKDCDGILCDAASADAARALGSDLPIVVIAPPATGTETGSPQGPPAHTVTLSIHPGTPPRVAEIRLGASDDATARAKSARLATEIALRLRLTPLRVAGGSILARMIMARDDAIRALADQGADLSAAVQAGLCPPVAEPTGARSSGTGNADLPHAPDHLLVLAMVNAGAQLLLDGVALRPGDIDLAMVLSGNWPRWRGGPMAEGDTLGPLVLRQQLESARALGTPWIPVPVLDEMVRHGWRFEDLNTG